MKKLHMKEVIQLGMQIVPPFNFINLFMDDRQDPLVSPQPEDLLVGLQQKDPLVTPHQEAPLVSTQQADLLVALQQKDPLVTPHQEAPFVST
jgi:hypothetical protein